MIHYLCTAIPADASTNKALFNSRQDQHLSNPFGLCITRELVQPISGAMAQSLPDHLTLTYWPVHWCSAVFGYRLWCCGRRKHTDGRNVMHKRGATFACHLDNLLGTSNIAGLESWMSNREIQMMIGIHTISTCTAVYMQSEGIARVWPNEIYMYMYSICNISKSCSFACKP